MNGFMKLRLLLGALALTLGACAPAQTVAPASAPQPADGATALATPLDRWWQLDAATNRGTDAERSYRELLAGREPVRSVVVAVIDGGVATGHEDLDDNLWTNEDEIPGNGVDDDRNGYVDDVHGWNFIGGPGGRDVQWDSYEVTRVYASLRPRCEAAPARAGCEKYAGIRDEFRADSTAAAEQHAQYATIGAAVDRAVVVLRQQIGADSLSPERVAAIQPTTPDVAQAREVYLRLAALGASPADVVEAREHFETQVRYGYNPAYDPRTIVGDNPADPNERIYGNADVEGPDAEHGTHVAGIAGAERGNGIGVDGIAPPNVRIMSVRAVPDGDERDKDVANAIRYAVDNGANVINMSFGKAYSPQKELVDEAVRYADSKGVLLVHAAGNAGASLDSENNFPNPRYLGGGQARNWIEVGASGPALDSLAAPFSNYSRTRVDVFAPGVGILSTVPGNGYKANQGTSMAAPVVSGLAALVMSFYPDLTAQQVRQIILDSATRYPTQRVVRPGEGGGSVTFGELSVTGGVVDAYAALQRAAERSGAR